MPYIEQSAREVLNGALAELGQTIMSPGELNYCISRLLVHILADREPLGYAELSAYNAAVKDAAVEFERRVLAPYEDRKRFENSDVYTELLRALGLHERPVWRGIRGLGKTVFFVDEEDSIPPGSQRCPDEDERPVPEGWGVCLRTGCGKRAVAHGYCADHTGIVEPGALPEDTFTGDEALPTAPCCAFVTGRRSRFDSSAASNVRRCTASAIPGKKYCQDHEKLIHGAGLPPETL